MVFDFGTGREVGAQIAYLKKKSQQLGHEENRFSSGVNTFDLAFYRLKKQKDKIQEEIMRLENMLRSDIIA